MTPGLAAPPRAGAARALLLMAAALAVFFAPAILTADQFLFRDAGRMHWSMKRHLASEIARGHLPQWNPYAGLGMPLVGGAIDAVQHPFNLLLVALPFEVGFKLWALLSYLVAASGAWLWARRLGRSSCASVAAGLAFALSGYLVGSSDNLTYLTTLSAVPWIFATAHAWMERGGTGRLALLGLASGLCAAGGDPQAWGFAVLALPAYSAMLAPPGGGRRALARGLGASAAAVVGAAPFVLPVLAWMPHSSRGDALQAVERQRWNLPPARLLELVVPHLFRDVPGSLDSPVYRAFAGADGTPIPWVLSIYTGASVTALALLGAVRSRPARWLVAGAAVFAWMALGSNAGFGQMASHLPLLRAFRYWEKMAIWPTLLLAMAGAFGVDELAERPEGARRFALAMGLAGVLAPSAAGLSALVPDRLAWLLAKSPDRLPAARLLAGNLRDGLLEAGAVCAALALVALAARRGALRPRLPAMLGLVVALDLLAANARGYLLSDPFIVQTRAPFGEYLASQPGLQRVFTPFDLTADRWPALMQYQAGWLWAAHMLAPTLNLRYRVGNFDAYAAMAPARVRRFGWQVPLAREARQLGIFGFGYLPVPLTPEMAGKAGLAPPYQVAAADPLLPAFLVRLPHRDRAYLAARLSQADERQALEFALAADASLTDESVVEGPVPAGYAPSKGRALIVEDAPERVVVETASDGPALLVLNDAWAAGWRAAVDGRPAEILPANYLARGVWVPAGAHRVEFAYRTPGLVVGWAVFAAGGLGLAGWAAAARGRAARPADGAEPRPRS